MSDELETAKAIATHPLSLGSVVAVFGWLANKVYRGIGHRIGNLEVAQQLASDATWRELDKRRETDTKLFDLLREHEEKDTERFETINNANRDRHDELLSVIGDLRADIAGLKK